MVRSNQTPRADAGQASKKDFTLFDRRSAWYVNDQIASAASRTIHHRLGRPVSVMITDLAGEVVYGDLLVPDLDTIRAWFSAAFSGVAGVA